MLSIGIVGLPNVGKSTLFNSLTKKQAPAENYPFCTIDPNIGMVEVPDKRLPILAKISKSEKIVPAVIEFVDIAGLIKGASQGEGLGNKFLSHIRECSAICQVVRGFEDSDIIHVHEKLDPQNDKEVVNLELALSDLSSVDKRLEKINRDIKSGDKKILAVKDLLIKIRSHLEKGLAVRDMELNEEEKNILSEFNLLTAKPMLYVLNIKDNQKPPIFSSNEQVIELNAKQEEEITNLPEEEREEYIRELGLEESGLDKLAQTAYKLLNLNSFLTTGTMETRAWTVRAGAKAVEASGVIHTDFAKNFIRAEVINWQDFVKAGSETKAKELGLIRTEGKDYIIKDGDVCHFLIGK